jgi:hypothetical protein
MRSRACLVAGFLVCGLLGGCSTTITTGSPKTPPAPGPPPGGLTAGDFTLTVPPGWTDSTRDPAELGGLHAAGPLSAVLTWMPPSPRAGVDDVRAVIAVSRVAEGPIPPVAMRGYLRSVADAGATGLSNPVPVSLDGEAGLEITFGHDIGGTPGTERDIVVTRDGTTYEITADGATADSPAIDAALEVVTAGWRWTAPPQSESPTPAAG